MRTSLDTKVHIYRKILVPLDASATAERALREAIAVARSNGATLRLLHVIDEGPALLNLDTPSQLEEYERALRESGERVLSQAQATAKAAGLDAEVVLKHVIDVQHHPADEIIAEATRWPADLIVIGTHGRHGWRRALLGSVAEGVARLAEQPVLLVRAAPH